MPESQGIVLTNRMNKVSGKHISSYSNFDDTLSYRHALSLRFGDYTPSFVMDGVEKDKITLNTSDDLDSMSLAAPFKGSIRKIKESFSVPNMAILPLNWDRIYVQPSNGDDVPDDANCIINNFPKLYSEFWLKLWNMVRAYLKNEDEISITFGDFATALMRTLVSGEYVYSFGSLLSVCGAKYAAQFHFSHKDLHDDSIDALVDYLLPIVFSGVKSFTIEWYEGSERRTRKFLGLSSEVSELSATNREFYGSLRSFVEFMRENPGARIIDETFFESQYWGDDEHGYMTEGEVNYLTYLQTTLLGESSDGVMSDYPLFYLPSDYNPLNPELNEPNPTTLDFTRLLAYQLVCAHYYTNSSIDFVYTAGLYRQYFKSLVDLRLLNHAAYSFVPEEPKFNWNGIRCPYDFLSGKMLATAICDLDDWYNGIYSVGSPTWYALTDTLFDTQDDSDEHEFFFSFLQLSAIFGFRKSLRYGDYFVGSRPRPLAPINTDVSVSDGKVSVIDITKSIQAQRFGNAVMRSRQKIEEYVKDLFNGPAPAPDYHNPFYLSREVETIFGDEVQNTAQGQLENPNSRTANFASNVGRYTFTFHNDDMHPCTYIQIISFDCKRAYTRAIERQFMRVNRYDMFNPDFQYIGDQPVYGMELGYPVGTTIPNVFGYQTRDEEYKQRFDQASGAFVHNLPGWLLTDRDQSVQSIGNLSPDFIRSHNTELDEFFLSLGGYSLSTYYHFICIVNNNVKAQRAMAVDPQILA